MLRLPLLLALALLTITPAFGHGGNGEETIVGGVAYGVVLEGTSERPAGLRVTARDAATGEAVDVPVASYLARSASGVQVEGMLERVDPFMWRSGAPFGEAGGWRVAVLDGAGRALVETVAWMMPPSPHRFDFVMGANEPFIVGREMHVRFLAYDETTGLPVEAPEDAVLVLERPAADAHDGSATAVERITLPLAPTGQPGEVSARHAFARGGPVLLSVGAASLGVPVGSLPPFDVEVLGEAAATEAAPGERSGVPGIAILLGVGGLALAAAWSARRRA